MAQPSLIFVSGGVRSGKSSFAERLASMQSEQTDGRLYYIACGRPSDPEMQERVARHKHDRLVSHKSWTTLEYPVAIEKAAPLLDTSGIVLLDCLTTLLNNEMFPLTENMDEWKIPAFLKEVKKRILNGINEIKQNAAYFIIVSNEVLHAPIMDGVTHAYSNMIGILHQEIVAMSDQAYLVEAGCAVIMKGGAK
jgi:adenosylcobinamide kinase / adenosylcobinamide-phosphate guanylyltransferase